MGLQYCNRRFQGRRPRLPTIAMNSDLFGVEFAILEKVEKGSVQAMFGLQLDDRWSLDGVLVYERGESMAVGECTDIRADVPSQGQQQTLTRCRRLKGISMTDGGGDLQASCSTFTCKRNMLVAMLSPHTTCGEVGFGGKDILTSTRPQQWRGACAGCTDLELAVDETLHLGSANGFAKHGSLQRKVGVLMLSLQGRDFPASWKRV